MKAITKYPGGKWKIAKWIISNIPEHRSYLEVFFGSGAVLFNKPRSPIETVNDLDDNVVNLFEWIRKDPERLAHEIYWTPYARQVFEGAFGGEFRGESNESLEKAVNFYIRLNMGYGFRTTGERVGWRNDIRGREKAYAAIEWSDLPKRIMQAAERLRGVQIEHQPAIKLIQRYNFLDVCIYADPPYVPNTRGKKQYRYEMDETDHEELLDTLLDHKGPVILSGYENELYNKRLKGWRKKQKKIRCITQSERTEVLWMNFEERGQIRLEDILGKEKGL